MFDFRALYAALDAERQARALSWPQLARTLGVSVTTIATMCERSAVEGDGVLQMLQWLDEPPERFIATATGAAVTPMKLPTPPVSGGVVRFDAQALFNALNHERELRVMTWAQLGRTVGCSATSLTNLANGGRVSFPGVANIAVWLKEPLARFTRIAPR